MDGKRKSSIWIWLLLIAVAALLLFVLWDRMFRAPGLPRAAQPAGSAPQDARAPLPDKTAGGEAGAPASSLPGYPPVIAPPTAAGQPSPIAIIGTVRNEHDRAPIAGAIIQVFAYSSSPSMVQKNSSAAGKFQIEAPPAYRYGIRALAAGFETFQDDSFFITRPSCEMEILMVPVIEVQGRVVDLQSNGIADALITLRNPNQRSDEVSTATTDAQGSFALAGIPRKGQYRIEAFHPAYDSLGMVSASLPTEREILLRMRPARATGSLAGTVGDRGRKPISGAEISLFEVSDGRPVSRVRSDKQGAYRFAGVREGYYFARVTAEGYMDSGANHGAVAVRANGESLLNFTLEAGLQIRGLVVNHQGEPVMQAALLYKLPDAPRWEAPRIISTDLEGRFQLSGLPDAEISFTVQHRDYIEITVRLRPSSREQTITLDSGLSIRGTVSDLRGTAIEKFLLSLRSATGNRIRNYPMTTTDGRFEIMGLPRDEYQLTLTYGNRSFTGSARLDLQASAEIVITLDPAGGGRGRNLLNIVKVR